MQLILHARRRSAANDGVCIRLEHRRREKIGRREYITSLVIHSRGPTNKK